MTSPGLSASPYRTVSWPFAVGMGLFVLGVCLCLVLYLCHTAGFTSELPQSQEALPQLQQEEWPSVSVTSDNEAPLNDNLDHPFSFPLHQVSPGLSYGRIRFQHSQSHFQGTNYQPAQEPVQVHVLVVSSAAIAENSASRPIVRLVPSMASSTVTGLLPVKTMVEQTGGIAGVNATYFKPDTGTALGLLMIRREIISGPLFRRAALLMTQDGQYHIEKMGFQGMLLLPEVVGGQSLMIDNVNQPRTDTRHTVLYSHRWGRVAPQIPSDGLQVQLVGGVVRQVSETRSLEIPKNGYVISGPKTLGMISLARLSESDDENKVYFRFHLDPIIPNLLHAVGGGPLLVHNGQLALDPASENLEAFPIVQPSPRTAVGIRQDGSLLLVSVEGRRPGVSIGASLQELAQLMKNLGAVDAMNLDGGSSTQMVVGDQVVTNAGANKSHMVSNGLVVVPY
ncbi:MAG: phosphodiester glycosidase family protein [Vampirovibrio sp.]|nr:phosphodiester glycosidase family protein [Vampirovibrio sp.]